MTQLERQALFQRYDAGPSLIRAAVSRMPVDALQWRPAPKKWSAHEIIVHCADSETISSTRIRYLVGEAEPVIAGYDQDRWASDMNYHALPLELSLAQVESVRAWTSAFIRMLPDSAWLRTGRHTEMKEPYSAETWLQIYAEHLEVHARQIARNVDAWKAARA
ncbi:MAG TPA: DinB family protein [Gemmatimonadales bacterium]|jgi:hypothetical protein